MTTAKAFVPLPTTDMPIKAPLFKFIGVMIRRDRHYFIMAHRDPRGLGPGLPLSPSDVSEAYGKNWGEAIAEILKELDGIAGPGFTLDLAAYTDEKWIDFPGNPPAMEIFADLVPDARFQLSLASSVD